MVKHTLWNKVIDLDLDRLPAAIEELEFYVHGCQHGWFPSRQNGEILHYRKYVGSKKPKGVLVFHHDLQSSSMRGIYLDGRKLGFALLMEYFVDKMGYALYAIDALGHGYSEGKRNFVPDFRVNRDDLEDFTRWVGCQHDVPLFLMGQGYGATLAILVGRMLQDNPPKTFGGIVSVSPKVCLGSDAPSKSMAFLLKSCLAPCVPSWRAPYIVPTTVPPERLWRDDNVRQLYCSMECGISSHEPYCVATANSMVSATQAAQQAIPTLTTPYCSITTCDTADHLADYAMTPGEDRMSLRTKARAGQDLLSDFSCAQQVVVFCERFMRKRSCAMDGRVIIL